jgi:HEPN domain-containing protein
MAQANRDLDFARTAARDGFHEWACFVAQQAAEKGLKAALYSQLRESRTHVLKDLVRDVDKDVPGTVLKCARVLDNYYIPTRYANGHDSGAPYLHYAADQSEQAIEYAGVLIEFSRSRMAGSR